MKAGEMTNEQLAKDLSSYALETDAKGWPTYSATLREAVARLRKVTARTDNGAVVAELQRRLKVAEDALEASLNYGNAEELRKARRKVKRALVAIREGGTGREAKNGKIASKINSRPRHACRKPLREELAAGGFAFFGFEDRKTRPEGRRVKQKIVKKTKERRAK